MRRHGDPNFPGCYGENRKIYGLISAAYRTRRGVVGVGSDSGPDHNFIATRGSIAAVDDSKVFSEGTARGHRINSIPDGDGPDISSSSEPHLDPVH